MAQRMDQLGIRLHLGVTEAGDAVQPDLAAGIAPC